MTADRLETDNAAMALAHRLRDWGVPEPAPKARSFIDDLTKRGWKPSFELTTRRPPRRDEECRLHAGEYAPPNCRACWSDRKAQRDAEQDAADQQRHASAQAALAAARAEVRRHTTTPDHDTTPTTDVAQAAPKETR